MLITGKTQTQKSRSTFTELQVSFLTLAGHLVKVDSKGEKRLSDGYGETRAHSSVNQVKISRCGTYAVSVGSDKVGKIWNLVSGEKI